MEKMLLELGISIYHPLAQNSITSDRNKELYPKDIEMGYHPLDNCKGKGFCIVARMFGCLGMDYPRDEFKIEIMDKFLEILF